MHFVGAELIKRQAASIGIELKELYLTGETPVEYYDNAMRKTLRNFKNEGIEYSIYGDIFLEDLKRYRQSRLSEAGVKGVFPLWRISTKKIAEEFIELGFKAVIVSVNEKYLDKSFLGRELDKDFLADIPFNVDPCGENGEYHSFVYGGPIFNCPVYFEKGEIRSTDYTIDKTNPASENVRISNLELKLI